jgi:hypothetical protein
VIFQQREEGCRRLLAAVAYSWGCPIRWRFSVDYDEDSLLYTLTATRADGDKRWKQAYQFTAEEVAHDKSDRATHMLRRKVLGMYQKALLAIGEKP